MTTAAQSPVSIATRCPFRSTRSLKNRYSRSRPRSNGSRGLCFSQSDARRDVLRNVPAGAGAGDASAEPSRPPPNASPPHIGDVRRPTSIHTPSFTHPRVRTPSFTHTLVHTHSHLTLHISPHASLPQVRNAATLSFASLLTKVVGFMNVAHAKSGGCNRRSVTGDDFFARFPALHPFLLSELASAATALERGAVHPSLYPILAVLSRLRPRASTCAITEPSTPPRSYRSFVGVPGVDLSPYAPPPRARSRRSSLRRRWPPPFAPPSARSPSAPSLRPAAPEGWIQRRARRASLRGGVTRTRRSRGGVRRRRPRVRRDVRRGWFRFVRVPRDGEPGGGDGGALVGVRGSRRRARRSRVPGRRGVSRARVVRVRPGGGHGAFHARQRRRRRGASRGGGGDVRRARRRRMV